MHIKTIGVIGANPVGREIALAALIGGYRVVLEDVSREMLEKGTAYIKQSLDERAAHRELSQQDRESALARFSTASRVDEVCRVADMLIETVPDEMEVKLEIFTIVDKFAKPGAILASNTSLSITEIASITFRTEDCIGMRFANPLRRITRVELVRGADTSDATIAACSEAARRMGMEVAIIYESAQPSAADSCTSPRERRDRMNSGRHIEILQGDLTEMNTDAIVNAANNDLQLGGGVAAAIRRKGGPKIQAECDGIGTIPIGGAAVTTGGELKARYVIHAASMELGGRTDALSLRSSTAHSLRIAAQKKLKTIAFPAVGTGIAGFPMRECAEIMLREVAKHFEGPTSLEKVSFVLFDKDALDTFQHAFDELKSGGAAAP